MHAQPLTAAEIAREIATLRRQMNDWLIEGRLDAETEADMLGQIADLEWDAEHPDGVEVDHPYVEKYAPTGGLNVDLFVKAFGKTPEEEFGS
jgi:hypothetical protein